MLSGRDQLRAWMDRSKLNQRQTADALGVHEVFISQILNGLRSPGLDNAVLIERVTGIPVESWVQSELHESTETVPGAPAKRKIAKR